MKLKMFAVKDNVQGEMMNPFLLRNAEEARRAFRQAVNSNKDNNICIYYKDMALYELGEYDSATGNISSNVEYVCSGADVKENKENKEA